MLFFLGCNSQYAELDRITTRAPFVVQLGAKTKLSGFDHSSSDLCNDMVVDRFENIYCAGNTGSGMAKISDGTNDGFVSKFDRTGKLLWIVQLGSQNAGNDSCSAVGVDNAGNVYCGGQTSGRIGTGEILNKDALSVIQERSAAATDRDGFVAKINPSGNILWIKQYGSYGEDGCNNLVVSPVGNAYCGSRTDGELGVDYATNTYEYLSATSTNPLVVKIDTNGNVKWIRQFGVLSVGAEHTAEDYCSSVAIDLDENVYCAGGTRGNIGETNGSPGGRDPFVWILDKNGMTLDMIQVGVASDANPEVINVNSDEECLDIVVDENKNIYCALQVVSAYGENSGGGIDGAVIKWNANREIEWVTQMGANTVATGFNNTGNQVFQSIALSNDGSIIIAGGTSGSTAATLKGSDDVFIAKFNATSGELIWARQHGSTGTDTCLNAFTDTFANIYCSGSTTANFAEANSGSTDAFILRVNPQGHL